MKIKVVYLFLVVTILLSFVGGYLENFNRTMYQFGAILITLMCSLASFFQLADKMEFRVNRLLVTVIFLLFGILLIGLSIHKQFNLYPFLLLTFVSLYYFFLTYKVKAKTLLIITNLTFLIFLFFSILLYTRVIPAPQKLNMFTYNILGLKLTTFIGLYGGTASIDSFAMLVAVINVLHGSGKKRYVMAFIAFFSSVATLRFTPYLIIILPLVSLYITKRQPFLTQRILVLIFFLSFLIPTIITSIFHYDLLDFVINRGLNGRAFLWRDMLELYQEKSLVDRLFGFGKSNDFIVKTWYFEVDNPHSVYLASLINYGIFIFMIFVIVVMKKIPRLLYKYKFVVIAILSAGIGNSVLIGFQNFAITIWLLYSLTSTNQYLENEKSILN